MLNTIGLAVRKDRSFWVETLRSYNPHRIVEAPFGGEVPQTPVEVWLVAADKSIQLDAYSFWLGTLTAPIVLITARTGAALRLAQANPSLALICHPLVAGGDFLDLLFLASRRTAGVRVIDVPRERQVERLWDLTASFSGTECLNEEGAEGRKRRKR